MTTRALSLHFLGSVEGLVPCVSSERPLWGFLTVGGHDLTWLESEELAPAILISILGF